MNVYFAIALAIIFCLIFIRSLSRGQKAWKVVLANVLVIYLFSMVALLAYIGDRSNGA